MRTINNTKNSVFLFLFLIASCFTFAQKKPQLSDPEIASVAVVANQIDIKYAEIALKRTKNKEVREFANLMIQDHKAIIAQAVQLVKKLKVTPKDNPVSKSLLETSHKTISKLNTEPVKEFNKAYIDNEVAYHKAVIETVKNVLIPQSKNAELRNLLETVVPALETHLSHAEMLQQKHAKK